MLRTHFSAAATLLLLLSVAKGQTPNTAVATINIENAVFDSKEGKHELAAIHTKDPEERQQQLGSLLKSVLNRMAPVILKFAEANKIGLIIDTSNPSTPDPILWTNQRGGNVLRKQADITKQIVNSFDGSLKSFPPITGDQRVLVVAVDQAILNTEEGKRELAAIGENATAAQKQTVSQTLRAKMIPVIVKIAEDSGADLVLDMSEPWPTGPVVGVGKQFEITAQAITAYNGR